MDSIFNIISAIVEDNTCAMVYRLRDYYISERNTQILIELLKKHGIRLYKR